MAWIYILYSLSIIAVLFSIVCIILSVMAGKVKLKRKDLKKEFKKSQKAVQIRLLIAAFIAIFIALVSFTLATSINAMMQQVTSAATVQALFGSNPDCKCYAKCTGNPEDDQKTSYELLFGSAAYQELLTYVPTKSDSGDKWSDCSSIKDKSFYLRDNITDEMADCYRDALADKQNIREDNEDRSKMTDDELRKDLKKLFSDYKVDGKNPNCGCDGYSKRLLNRKCLGGEHFGSEWSWQRIEEAIDSIIGGPSSDAGYSGYVPGNATGPYAIELDDGSYYWYHQSQGCSCTYCGNWSGLVWGNPPGPNTLGRDGCAVYSLAMIVSNLKGAEITPSEILKTLNSTISGSTCTTSSSYFSGRAIKRGEAVEKIASTYGLNVVAIDKTEAAIDDILSKGGYVWGSWHGPFEWYSGDGHFMAIRKGTENGYYCFTSCRNSALGVSGKPGAILTMNTVSAKSKVISYANSGQFYGFWVDRPTDPSDGNGTFGDTGTNTDVYNILVNNGYNKDKAYAMAAAYGATSSKYGHNFAVGLMANILHEGKPGQIEGNWGSPYWNAPGVSQAVRDLNYKVISNVSMVDTLLTIPSGVDGIGVGSIQWSGSRRPGILNLYKSRATQYSQAELGAIDVQYMIQEFAGGFAGVPSACSGKSAAECASIICKQYERPAGMNQKAVERANTAANLTNLLGGN